MDALTRAINDTLDDDDRRTLESVGRDRSLIEMVLDLFQGRHALLNLSLMVGQIVFFVIGLYAAWQAYALADLIEVVRWGLVAVFFLTCAVVAKATLLTSMQVDRTMREVKRLELQVALLANKH